MANTKIDQLSYTYANAEVSNKLLKVEDSSGSPEGFKNGDNLATEYTYDGNGNMLRDYNKGITTNIIYNHLNLPSQITFASGNIQYIYDAVGAKQKKIVTEATGTTTTIYAGNYIYQNSVLQMISQPEGYIEPNTAQTVFSYGYRLKDHLGNIRLTFVDFDHNGSIALSEITEENNYYPFGLKHKGYNNVISSNTNAVAGKFKYNSKELNDELGLDWYDYGARFYDAALGRWHSIDPLAENYINISPYAYVANNPILYTDPDGRDIRISRDDEEQTMTVEGNFYYNLSQIDPNGKYGSLEAILNALDSWANDIQTAVSTMDGLEEYSAIVNFSMVNVEVGDASDSDAITLIREAANADPIGNSIVHDPSISLDGNQAVVSNNKHLKADMRNVRSDPILFAGNNDDGTYYKGNSLKHEIGHFFGLRDRADEPYRTIQHAAHIKGDLMSYGFPLNNAVNPFIRVMHFTGLKSSGTNSVIINRNNREPLQ